MNDWQEKRLKEFCGYYKWPIDDTRKMFENSREFYELVWLGMDTKDRKQEEDYYNGPWLTLRQMSYPEGDAWPNTVCWFIDEMESGETLLDFGCGTGDLLHYASFRGIKCTGIELPGKVEFLKYRRNLASGNWKILSEIPMDIKFDRAIAISSLDHVTSPILVARVICSLTKGKVMATPCIDETYDRPTHNKAILKHVPAAFKVIEEHNAHLRT